MELLFRVSLCLLTFIGKTFGDEIGIVKISCKEDEDVMLSCSFEENLRMTRFDWKKDGKDVLLCEYGEISPSKQDGQFRERVSHFTNQLKSGNASIIIKKAKVSDSGNYTCLHIDSKKSWKIVLTVGTCPTPSISILNEVNGGTLVECEAHGAYPKPTMEVQNSGNMTVAEAANITRNGNYFDAILQVVVTKKDHYHCVVKQEDICHQIYSKPTFVHVTPGTCPTPSISILNEVNGGTLVECEAHGAYPKPTMEVQNSGNMTVAEAANITRNGNYFDAILQVVVTKKDHYHCVVKQEDICHQIYSKPTFVHVTPGNTTEENTTEERSGSSKGFIHGGGVGVGVVIVIAIAALL
ncbi:CD276 antigen homolog isoform X2 [Gambusia affinis]|uniref:CD276 antigen homolog isoform X2 n=1 Tax=Gambusia affinis TaxID=33528 RepID=UPI001CDCD3CB|nr:CD276 antigen homolog isoform X2 [Gambusia affinis]